MGSGKIVRLLTEQPFPELQIPGAAITCMLSPFEAEIELDTELLKINDFIAKINSLCTLTDMSVQELPIERVIKHLYTAGQSPVPSTRLPHLESVY